MSCVLSCVSCRVLCGSPCVIYYKNKTLFSASCQGLPVVRFACLSRAPNPRPPARIDLGNLSSPELPFTWLVATPPLWSTVGRLPCSTGLATSAFIASPAWLGPFFLHTTVSNPHPQHDVPPFSRKSRFNGLGGQPSCRRERGSEEGTSWPSWYM